MVTGAAGSIGTYLVDKLVEKDVDVLATGFSQGGQAYFEERKISYAQLDITQSKNFYKLPKNKVDAVVHLAALIPERSTENTTGEDYLRINALGTYNVLEYCRRNSIKKVVYTTSHYEASNIQHLPVKETEIDFKYTGDHALYIISKLAGAQYVRHFTEEYGMQGIILRSTSVRGYYHYAGLHKDAVVRKSHWERFIEKAAKGEPIEIWGNPTEHVRDHIYVKDAVDCIIAAINSETAIGRYNMASGVGITFEDEVKSIIKVFSPPNHASKLIYCPEKPNNIERSWIYDISKTKQDLNWSPNYSTEDALRDIKKEMEKNGAIKSNS
jgi:UDP-glucose 4-epimerase